MKMQKINFKQWIISGIVGLAVFSAIGCSQSGNNANGNTATNSNSANKNTAVNNSVANSNANANKPESKPTNTSSASNSESANSQTNKPTESADKEKGDCTVKADNTDFFIEETEKTVKLKKGTSIQYIQFGNQGIAIVKAQIDGKWVRGEIKDDLIDCPEEK